MNPPTFGHPPIWPSPRIKIFDSPPHFRAKKFSIPPIKVGGMTLCNKRPTDRQADRQTYGHIQEK